MVTSCIKLKEKCLLYRYHMTLDPHEDVPYISDAESHRVIRLLDVINPIDIETNFETVIGSGIRCLPGES